jgi:hypothetical protein
MRPYDEHIAKNATRIAHREREPIPTCWFCSTPEGRSKEHIFPRWLTGDLGAREFEVTPFHTHLTGGSVHELSTRPLAGLVATKICAKCNNGWMSHLETQVRPLLTGGALTGQVTPHWAQALAHWFAKTAAVLNVSQNYRMVIRREDRHALATGIPSNVAVALSRVERRDATMIDWQQSSPLMVLTQGPVMTEYTRGLIERTLVCNIQAGALGATVVFAARPLTASAVDEFVGGSQIWPLPGRLPWVSALPRVDSIREVMPSLHLPDNPFLRQT